MRVRFKSIQPVGSVKSISYEVSTVNPKRLLGDSRLSHLVFPACPSLLMRTISRDRSAPVRAAPPCRAVSVAYVVREKTSAPEGNARGASCARRRGRTNRGYAARAGAAVAAMHLSHFPIPDIRGSGRPSPVLKFAWHRRHTYIFELDMEGLDPIPVLGCVASYSRCVCRSFGPESTRAGEVRNCAFEVIRALKKLVADCSSKATENPVAFAA